MPHDCSKINLGIGAYGRSWTLADRTKTTVGSPAYAAGPAGKCTGEDWPAERAQCLDTHQWGHRDGQADGMGKMVVLGGGVGVWGGWWGAAWSSGWRARGPWLGKG